ECLLLVGVPVILVARELPVATRGGPVRARVEPDRVRKVRIGRREAVDRRRSRRGRERLAVRVRRPRIRAEVVVEGDVLLEDHHDVLDGRRGRTGASCTRSRVRRGGRRRGGDHDERGQDPTDPNSHYSPFSWWAGLPWAILGSAARLVGDAPANGRKRCGYMDRTWSSVAASGLPASCRAWASVP